MVFKDLFLLWLQIFDCVLSFISVFCCFWAFICHYFTFLFSFLNSASSHLFAFIVLPLSALFEVSLQTLTSLKLCIESSLQIHPLLSWDNFFKYTH